MIFSSNSISCEAALRLTGLVRDHAAAHGWTVAVSVVDRQGIPVAMLRMDGVVPPVLDFAGDKAHTAATMRRPTREVFERMSATPRMQMGAASRPRLLVWGGGLPIVHGAEVIGGIGVSGAKEDEDVACAEAALAGMGLGWRL